MNIRTRINQGLSTWTASWGNFAKYFNSQIFDARWQSCRNKFWKWPPISQFWTWCTITNRSKKSKTILFTFPNNFRDYGLAFPNQYKHYRMDKVERHSGGRCVYSCGRKGWVVGVPNLFLKKSPKSILLYIVFMKFWPTLQSIWNCNICGWSEAWTKLISIFPSCQFEKRPIELEAPRR